MSRLWREDRAQQAASVGSFVIRPSGNSFRPWVGDSDKGAPASNDGAFTAEDPAVQREEEAYLRGLSDGRRTVEAEVAAERNAIAQLAEALQELKPQPTLPLALLLAETVDRLVREVIGEVEIDGIRLLARAKAAAALIGEATQPARLKVHPDDFAILSEAQLEVEIESDAALPRGTVLLETGDGWIEDGPAVRLDRLRAELDKVAATR
jgi:flagellar assembly protein FliH